MVRHLVSVLLAVLPFAVPAQAADEALAIVNGIAAGDLLNVRADASPIGHVETRLGNGEALRKFECSDVNGYQWCKVQVVDRPDVTGWVPARYLLPVDPEGTATAADTEDASANAAAAAGTVQQGDTDAQPAAVPATQQENAAHANAAPDLAARFGDPAPAPGVPSAAAQAQPAPSSGMTSAEADAYRLAFAARAKAAATAGQDTPKADAASDETVAPSAGVMVEDGEPPPVTGSATGVPIPTPRPQLPGETPVATTAPTTANSPAANRAEGASTQIASAVPESELADQPAQIAALPEPKTATQAWDATGEIPCARYVGQPMTRCRVGIKREGGGKADVTVTWPDGGTRVIGFYDGKPAGADSRAEFRFTREGALNMIRVGVSERFEITDSLAFGD